MDNPGIDVLREQLTFAQNIALAELEKAKADERVYELKYESARFNLEAYVQLMKSKQGQGA